MAQDYYDEYSDENYEGRDYPQRGEKDEQAPYYQEAAGAPPQENPHRRGPCDDGDYYSGSRIFL